LKLTLLGTGTSQGVPVIGCDCTVCQSQNPHDKRLRSAALLQHNDLNIVIDPGPDFRQQMLRANVKHLNAILITHEHNDHIIGIDDVRPFNFASGEAMKVYALPRVANDLKHRFQYVFKDPIPGLPRIELHHIDQNSVLQFQDLQVKTINVLHGNLPILGFQFGKMAYLTDVKTLPETELPKLTGLEHLIINALHHHPHPTHLNVQECLQLIQQIDPTHAWLTHMSHHIGLEKDFTKELPTGVLPGYDGLVIEL
jgi:phosphoribosyl 1,2-cyclic phosphate phosphodiesterase